LKGKYYTIEIDHYIQMFEWREYVSIRQVVSDISQMCELGFTDYDYKPLLF
jgi:hypothetical protein